VVGVGRGIFDYYFQLKEKEAIITNTASNVSNNLRTD
jgi:penicillin-binding protein 2